MNFCFREDCQVLYSHRFLGNFVGCLRVTEIHLWNNFMEKEMATHSSVLAWRIPGTGEPGGLPSMGSHSQTRLKWLSLAKLRVVPDVALGPAAWKFPFIPSPRNTRNPLTSLRNNLWTPCAECIIIACRAKILWYCSVSLSSRLGFLLLPLWCLSDDYFLWMLLCLHPLIKYWCLFISLLSIYFSLFQGFSKWRESAPRWVSEWEGEREEEV